VSLEVKGLVKHFDGVQAVNGVSFSLQPGECVALIGPNGAGKSTSFACIAGQLAPTRGEVWWNGARIDTLAPPQRLRRGVARTFQVAQTFEALTVLQNVQLLTQSPWGLAAHDVLDDVARASAMTLLEQVGLADRAQSFAQDLPYGAKKRLELAMALAGLQRMPAAVPLQRPTDGQLLLLDEPAAGLAAAERAALMGLVRGLTQVRLGARAPMAVLYTEHNMDAVFGVADRVLVLIDGVIAAQGTPEAIAQDPTVRSRYLGQWWSHAALAGAASAGALAGGGHA
jgi:branched-chain amino acid transport system ATP-binding protein